MAGCPRSTGISGIGIVHPIPLAIPRIRLRSAGLQIPGIRRHRIGRLRLRNLGLPNHRRCKCRLGGFSLRDFGFCRRLLPRCGWHLPSCPGSRIRTGNTRMRDSIALNLIGHDELLISRPSARFRAHSLQRLLRRGPRWNRRSLQHSQHYVAPCGKTKPSLGNSRATSTATAPYLPTPSYQHRQRRPGQTTRQCPCGAVSSC